MGGFVQGLRGRREILVLGALIVLAAGLRVATLGTESFWFDEVRTADIAASGSPVDVLREVWGGETTPPLYFLVIWAWRGVAGHGDAALRLVSALAGIATIPVAYAIGAKIDRPRTGLIAAALVATSPLLLHYSQENRPYALLAFLSALSILLLLRGLERPTTERLAAWVVCCVLAMADHYCAVFIVAPEAGVLLWRLQLDRRALLACAGLVAGGAVIAPVALHQISLGHADFVTRIALSHRLEEVTHQFVKGTMRAPWGWTGPASVTLLVVGAALLALGGRDALRTAALPLGLGVAALGLPILLALVGRDVVLFRNLIGAWVPLAVALSVGFSSTRYGLVAAAGLVAVWAAIWAGMLSDDSYQRADWKDAAKAIGAPSGAHVVAVKPGYSDDPLGRYGHPLVPLGSRSLRTDDIIVVGEYRVSALRSALPTLPGFRLAERRQIQKIGLAHYRSTAPRQVRGSALALGKEEKGIRPYVERGG